MGKKLDSISKSDTPEVSTPLEVKPEEKPAEATSPVETPKKETPKGSEEEKAVGTAPETKSEPNQAESFESMFPEPTVVINGPPPWIWWFLLLIASLILAAAGYKLFLDGRLDQWLSVGSHKTTAAATPAATPTVTPTSTTTLTPTPRATPVSSPLAKSAITLSVLNGTTTAGAASATKTTLQKAGFTVRTIGNAKTQDYKTTIVYYQNGHQAEANLVVTALNNTSATTEESTLANPDMVLVVIGLK